MPTTFGPDSDGLAGVEAPSVPSRRYHSGRRYTGPWLFDDGPRCLDCWFLEQHGFYK